MDTANHTEELIIWSPKNWSKNILNILKAKSQPVKKVIDHLKIKLIDIVLTKDQYSISNLLLLVR